MSELNLIKTVLFNAADLNEALTRLDELGIIYRESETVDMWFIDSHNIQFWPSRSARCPLAVCINNSLQTFDDRLSFLADQQETGETSVPAASPDAGQRLVSDADKAEIAWESHSNSLFEVSHRQFYPKIPLADLMQLRANLREERRLKRSQAKGLLS